MKKIVFLLNMLLLVALLSACNQKADKKESTENIKEKIDLSTKENYEKFLAEWGIAIPENSTFKELKKTSDGNYKIFYNVAPFVNILDSLQNFYENQFDQILLSQGWTKPSTGWNPHGTEYTKDGSYFKFFIVVSDEHKIYELAFKYGQ